MLRRPLPRALCVLTVVLFAACDSTPDARHAAPTDADGVATEVEDPPAVVHDATAAQAPVRSESAPHETSPTDSGQRDAHDDATNADTSQDAEVSPADATAMEDATAPRDAAPSELDAEQPDAEAEAGDTGADVDAFPCDPSRIRCRRAYPSCPEGQVPSVEGTCYGPCVPVYQCTCEAADHCPELEKYTCHSRSHCDYYVF